MGVLVPDAIPEMLRKMTAAPRFRDMKLSCFVDHLDVGKGEQFAALTIETGDGFFYLSFRGTDDTLAGWKEDFDLACMPEVPAQKKAVAYLTEVARQYPRQKLRLGGHSKGGNLAVYAGVFWPGRRCSGGSPRCGPTTARAFTRICWTCPSTAGWRSGSIPLFQNPQWWGCCWSMRSPIPWWTATSWGFSSTTAFPGRLWETIL